LKARTLTKLYNVFPAWLRSAHEKLDVSVAAAYGWKWPLSDEEILQRLLAENLRRSAAAAALPEVSRSVETTEQAPSGDAESLQAWDP